MTLTVAFSGTGSSLYVARADHDHDARYYTESELQGDGTAQVHWDNLSNVPADIADGDDDVLGGLSCDDGEIAKWNSVAWICTADADSGGDITAVNAGAGLTGGGASGSVTLGVDFAGSGSASTVARSDHNHDAAYVNDDAGEVGDADVPAGALSPDRISGTAWTSANDGAGSGLDADLLDGQHASAFATASHDHWGETWSGTGAGLTLNGSNAAGFTLDVTDSGAGVNAAAIHGRGGSASSRLPSARVGVWGESYDGFGVYGGSDSGNGVHGDSLSAPGVLGTSATGTGVYASGGNYGVEANGTVGDLSLNGSLGDIYATGTSGADMELHSNDHIDLHLDDDSNSISQFRILNGADTTAFTVTETGAVSWMPQTGYLSLSAADFQPQVDGYDFSNTGQRLQNVDGSSDNYIAPVQLPHGATVTRLTFYWRDTSSSNGVLSLYRNGLAGTSSLMAYASTSGNAGNGSSYDSTISYATVDNSQYSYFLSLGLPDSNVWCYGAIIEYTYTGPH